jgi:hypothetical protein
MTAKQLQKLVRVWQGRLGLQAWDIKVSFVPTSFCSCAEDAEATTWRQNDYDRAVIFPNTDWTSWDDDRLSRLMVHELMHLVTRDLDRVIASVEEQVHPDAWRMVNTRYDHEIEGVVDRLANRIVDLCS